MPLDSASNDIQVVRLKLLSRSLLHDCSEDFRCIYLTNQLKLKHIRLNLERTRNIVAIRSFFNGYVCEIYCPTTSVKSYNYLNLLYLQVISWYYIDYANNVFSHFSSWCCIWSISTFSLHRNTWQQRNKLVPVIVTSCTDWDYPNQNERTSYNCSHIPYYNSSSGLAIRPLVLDHILVITSNWNPWMYVDIHAAVSCDFFLAI